jgi:hypothetical protein
MTYQDSIAEIIRLVHESKNDELKSLLNSEMDFNNPKSVAKMLAYFNNFSD